MIWTSEFALFQHGSLSDNEYLEDGRAKVSSSLTAARGFTGVPSHFNQRTLTTRNAANPNCKKYQTDQPPSISSAKARAFPKQGARSNGKRFGQAVAVFLSICCYCSSM